jgi:LemA protein
MSNTENAAKPTPLPKWVIWAVLGAILAISSCSSYNGMNKSFNHVQEKAAGIQTQLQRRGDLIPNIVESVKAEASFEKSTLQAVIDARASATSIKLTPEVLNDPAAMQKFQAAQGALSGSLSRLLVVAESYPTLKANAAFKDLRVSLEGTENRIRVARDDFNKAAASYNTDIGEIPTVFFASIFRYNKITLFAAEEGKTAAPVVKF